jgi:hypothetical protein
MRSYFTSSHLEHGKGEIVAQKTFVYRTQVAIWRDLREKNDCSCLQSACIDFVYWRPSSFLRSKQEDRAWSAVFGEDCDLD